MNYETEIFRISLLNEHKQVRFLILTYKRYFLSAYQVEFNPSL